MSRFEILEIGEELDGAAGVPEGCELCGHCIVMRHTLAAGSPLPCGGVARGAGSDDRFEPPAGRRPGGAT